MIVYNQNILDLFLTLYAVSHGGAELNPVANAMIALHPLVYAFYKVAVCGVLCWWLSRRDEPIARYGLWALAVVFAAVDAWHICHLIIGGILP